MKRGIRGEKRVLRAVLALLALLLQSALPVCAADTTGGEGGNAGTGYTIEEESNVFGLAYFDRIAVNSVKGTLTIRSGDDFGIAFPSGGDEIPAFSVQDDILVVSGKRNAEVSYEKSGSGSAVALGEDEPAADGGSATGAAAEAGRKESAAAEKTAADSTLQMVITIPSGVGLDTLRIAMESGDLMLSDITAGSVTVQSGGGNMIMKNVSLGTVDVYSDAGSLTMERGTFGSLNIGMNSGNVSVNSGEGLSRCKMELKTGNGGITYNGNSKGAQYLQPGNGKRFLMIQVGTGNIDISE